MGALDPSTLRPFDKLRARKLRARKLREQKYETPTQPLLEPFPLPEPVEGSGPLHMRPSTLRQAQGAEGKLRERKPRERAGYFALTKLPGATVMS
jgi:hypothetical protein